MVRIFNAPVLEFSKVLFCFAFLALCSFTNLHSVEDQEADGIIIVEAELAKVDTNDDNITVDLVHVFDLNANLSLEVNGCNYSYCEYDLSGLNSGQHLIKVYLSNGSIHNLWTYLN